MKNCVNMSQQQVALLQYKAVVYVAQLQLCIAVSRRFVLEICLHNFYTFCCYGFYFFTDDGCT